jgi:hypothetical protein
MASDLSNRSFPYILSLRVFSGFILVIAVLDESHIRGCEYGVFAGFN